MILRGWVAMMEPETVGLLGVTGVWTLLLCAGIFKCISISRRETTSLVCVLSLIFALLVFAGCQLIPLAKAAALEPVGSLLIALVVLLLIFMAIAGLMLGIVGLVGYRHSYARGGIKKKYVQGRVQARWGIALNAGFIGLVFLGILGALFAKVNQNKMQQIATGSRRSEYIFADQNFRLTLPNPQKWVEMDVEKIMPDSNVVLMRQSPNIYLSVIAEEPGVGFGMTTEQLVEIAQANLKARIPDARFSEITPRVLNGLEGQTYTVEASVGLVDFSYRFWCYANHGYCYQVFLWSSRRDAKALYVYADRVLEGFRQIDPEKRYFTEGNTSFGTYESPQFAYSINLQSSDWLGWDAVRESDPFADSGGILPSGIRFSITPLLLPERDVSTPLLHRSLMELYEYVEPFNEGAVKAISVQNLQGISYAYSNGENRCVEQLLLSTNCAYLVSVWCPKDEDDGLGDAAQSVFDAVSYAPAQIESNTLEGLPADRKVVQGRMLNQIGLSYYDAGRYPEALEWFEDGFNCDGTNATYFGNILAAHRQLNQYPEALALLRTVDEEMRNDSSVLSWEASLLAGEGKVTEADAVYATLYQPEYRNDDDFMAWTTMRADNGLWEGMDELFEDYLEKNSTASLRLHQLDLYYGKEDYQKVVDLSRGFLAKHGFSLDVAYWLIEAFQDLGLYKEALEVCDQSLSKGHSTVDLCLEKAYSEYQLKWYRKSKQTLEMALQMNPQNETTQEWLQLVSAELGEGDNSCLKEAIEEVVAPVELDALFAGVPEADFGREFGAYYTRRLMLWNYEKGAELKRTNVSFIKVLDEAGVSLFSSLEYAFNPVSQKIFVNRLLVRNGQGEIVARGAIKDYYVMDDTSDGQASEDKKLVIPVPSLQPGYTLEAVITKTYPAEPDEFYFTRHFLAASVPVFHAAVCLSGELEEIAYAKLNGVDETRRTNGVCWVGRAPCSYRWEPMQLQIERFVPGIILGPAGSSWKECGLDYLGQIKDRLEGTDRLRQQVGELVEGVTDKEEQYKIIVDWIRSSFTYKPLEFGRNAFIPDTASDTLAFRYGDCKDLSVLLKAMLQVVGVDCELVLANSSDDIFLEIATTDQFNHMVVYLPHMRGGMVVDPTDASADAFLSVPNGLQKSRVLVLDPTGPFLKELPAYAENSSRCIIERSVEYGPEGTVGISDQVRLNGYYASWMRSVFKEQQKIKWVKWFQQNIADFVPGLKVESVTAHQVNDAAKDLKIHIAYTLHDASREDEAGLTLKVPSIWARHYLAVAHVPDRKNPFGRNYPLSMEVSWQVDAPEGFRAQPVSSEEGIKVEGAFIDWKTEGSEKRPHFFGCQLKAGEFEAEQYNAFVTAMENALNAASLEMVFPRVSPSREGKTQ